MLTEMKYEIYRAITEVNRSALSESEALAILTPLYTALDLLEQDTQPQTNTMKQIGYNLSSDRSSFQLYMEIV
jgi:hypothetical protein